MKKAPIEFITYIGGGVLGALLAFGQTAVYGNLLDPAQYGAVSMLERVMAFLAALMVFGLDVSLARLYFDHNQSEGGLRKYLSSLFLGWLVIAGAVSLLAALILNLTVGRLFLMEEGMRELIPLVIASSAFTSIITILRRLKVAERKPLGYTALASGVRGLVLSGTLVALLVMASVRMVVLGEFFGMGIGVAVAIYVERRRIFSKPDWSIARSSLILGAPLVINVFTNLLFGMADRLVLENSHGLADVGLFSIAQALSQGMAVVLVAAARVWSPRFMAAETSGKGSLSEFRMVGTLFVGLAAMMAGALALFGGELMTLMGKTAYMQAVPAFRLLLFANLILASYYVDNSAILLYKKTGLLAAITIASGIVNLVADIVLIPRYAAIGSAWASVLALGTMALLSRLAAARSYRGRFEGGPVTRLLLIGGALTLGLNLVEPVFWVRGLILVLLGTYIAVELLRSAIRNQVAGSAGEVLALISAPIRAARQSRRRSP